jgi:hypothetical protein
MTSKLKIAINLGLYCLALLLSTSVYADTIAKVINLSGVLSAQNTQGQVRFLAQESSIEIGDTLKTEEDTFARLKFTDGGEVTLKPKSVFMVENYAFNRNNPTADAMEYNLIKGSMRAVTGLISKRGNPDAYQGKAVTATIGIRGTDYEARLCMSDCDHEQDGLYTSVYEGIIITSNAFGSQDIGTGQFGFASFTQTPIILPMNPNIFIPIPQNTNLRDIALGIASVSTNDEHKAQSCKIE